MRHLVPLLVLAAALPLGAQSRTPDRLPPKQTTGAAGAPASPQPTPPPRRDYPDRVPRDNGTGVYLGTGRDVIAKRQGWIDDGRMHAALWAPSANHVVFELSRPAYVALFEIQPGRGVRTIYAADVTETLLPGGPHQVPSSTMGDPLSGVGAPPERGPRYLYLVASEYPLGFPPQRGTVSSLQALLGAITFQSGSQYEVASALRQRVLTLQPIVGSWTDAIVSFPAAGGAGNRGGTSVTCPNGTTYAVTPGTNFICPR